VLNLPPELQGALLGRRMVFLRGRLDDTAASGVISQLLLLGQMGDGGAIDLYVDSPGGSFAASLAVYDVLRTLAAPVSTTCLATAAGAAVLIVAAGTAGRRFALPHARLHLTEETQDMPISVRPGDVASQAAEIAGLRTRWRTALVQHSGHSAAQVERDLKTGRWLSAAEARDYGLVDGIIPGAPR
jgi:ATP-dependent Clp protease protease subunit